MYTTCLSSLTFKIPNVILKSQQRNERPLNTMKWIILIVCIIFFTASFLIGHLINCLCRLKDQTIFINIFSGVITIWGLLELILVPMTFFKVSFQTLSFIYALLLVICCLASFLFWGKMKDLISEFFRNWKAYFSWTFLIAAAIILFQLYFIHHNTYYEWDDAYYVGLANEAVHSNVILGVEPESGVGYSFSLRYAFSLWPIFYALLGNWFQISPTIMAHTILPFIIIPFAYLIYMLMASLLFPEDKEAQGYFLTLSAILHMFMTHVHAIGGSFLLLTPWVGKAPLACISMPAVVYLMLRLTKQNESNGNWILLFILSLSTSLHSSMGIVFFPVLAGSLGLLWSIKNKLYSFFIKTVICCTPSIIMGISYLKLT